MMGILRDAECSIRPEIYSGLDLNKFCDFTSQKQN